MISISYSYYLYADVEPPVLSSCLNQTAPIYDNATSRSMSWPLPNVTDNSGMAVTRCYPSGGSVFSLGWTDVTCNASDASGNAAECVFNVFVYSKCKIITLGGGWGGALKGIRSVIQ